MNFEIITEGSEKYLKVFGEALVDSYEYRMLNHNDPAGFLPLQRRFENGERCYLYAISGLISLKEAMNAGDRNYLEGIILALEHIVEELNELFLSADRLLLSPEQIFIRPENGMFCFCYYPGKKESVRASLETLMEFFVKTMNPTEEDDVMLLYGLYQRTRETNVTIGTLTTYWREKRKEKLRSDPEAYVAGPGPEEEDKTYYDSLGLTVPVKKTAFSGWLARRQKALPEPAAVAKGRMSSDSVCMKEVHLPAVREPGSEPKEIKIPEDPWRTGAVLYDDIYIDSGREKHILKKYGFEIAIGVICAAGAALILLL